MKMLRINTESPANRSSSENAHPLQPGAGFGSLVADAVVVMKPEAFALQVYRRFVKGETIACLSRDLGIPADRIETRIRAAARFLEDHATAGFLEDWHTWA